MMTSDPYGKQYPVLNRNLLLAHPTKRSKPNDLERIFTSKLSEDYVTWNVVQLLQATPVAQWWDGFIRLVRIDNSEFTPELKADDLPIFEVWKKYKSPSAYEQHSRDRMAQSRNQTWIVRSKNMRAVEGDSEIDLVISGHNYLIFVEAKLEADISLGTTYDPERNQIVRNIDVVLEQCGIRVPCFLLMVKDQRLERKYVQILRGYQRNPMTLAQALPHRNLETVMRIASNLGILLWKDVLALIPYIPEDVRMELKRRIDT